MSPSVNDGYHTCIMELPKQFDNITSRVIDDLKAALRSGARVSVAAASFSIYAFEALQRELEQVSELRFIFTSPTFNKERAKRRRHGISSTTTSMMPLGYRTCNNGEEKIICHRNARK